MATTGKIDTLLCAMPLEERHRELLYKRLPDTEIYTADICVRRRKM